MALDRLKTRRLRMRWLWFLLPGIPLIVHGQVNTPQSVQKEQAVRAVQGHLESGKDVRGELKEGESHSYLIGLTAGQFMQVLVSKSIIRMNVRLVSVKENENLVELNLPPKAEPERPLCWVAK